MRTKFNTKHLKLFFLSILLLLIFRQMKRISFPMLYAEDGALFFKQSIVLGMKSFFVPYAGYFQLLPQIISYICLKISLYHYTFLNLFFATFFYCYAICQLLKPAYSWLCKPVLPRIALVLSLTFLPGTSEVIGVISDIHSVLFIWMFIRMLSSFKDKFSLIDYIIVFFCIFSAAETVLVLPVIIYRILILRKTHLTVKNNLENTHPNFKKNSLLHKKNIHSHFIIVFILFTGIIFNIFSYHEINNNIGFFSSLKTYFIQVIDYLPRRFFMGLFNRLFFIPLFGDYITIQINRHWQLILWLGGALFILLVYIYTKLKLANRYFTFLIFTVICQYLIIFLTIYVRKGSYQTSYFGQLREGYQEFYHRYMLFGTPLILVFWTYFINRLVKKNTAKYVAILIFHLHYWLLSSDRFIYKEYQKLPEHSWYTYSEKLDQIINHGSKEPIFIPIIPPSDQPANEWFISLP